MRNRIGHPKNLNKESFKVSKSGNDVKLFAKYNNKWFSTSLDKKLKLVNQHVSPRVNGIIAYNKKNEGIINSSITVDSTSDPVLKLWYDNTNYATLTTTTNGATTLATVDSDGNAGDLTLDADGDIKLEAAGGDVTLDAKTTVTVSDFGANAAFKIDADQPATVFAEQSAGLHIDYDRIVAGAGTEIHHDRGIDLDVNTASLGNSFAWGMDIDVVGATSGNHISTGIDINVSGSDKNRGLDITVPAGAADSHLKLIAADATTDYAKFHVDDTGSLEIVTNGGGTRDSHVTIDADGDIILDAASGKFVAKNDGTEFSQANSAYAGMILGCTDIGRNEGHATYDLTTSYAVPTDEFKVSFIIPPSGNVLIEVQIQHDNGSSGVGDLYAGLSTTNATTGYTSLAVFHEKRINDNQGRGAVDIFNISWTMVGLTSGAAEEIWAGFKVASTSGTPKLYWGGSTNDRYPDFIMKATALPVNITL